METEILDKLYLEWSQFTNAETKKERIMRLAMQEFVDRCDKGEVRSKYTYQNFSRILRGEF